MLKIKEINENKWQESYSQEQEYNCRNLCDKCKKHPATCEVDGKAIDKKLIKYNNTFNNDNVIECFYFEEKIEE